MAARPGEDPAVHPASAIAGLDGVPAHERERTALASLYDHVAGSRGWISARIAAGCRDRLRSRRGATRRVGALALHSGATDRSQGCLCTAVRDVGWVHG